MEGLNDAVDSISETLKHDYVLATLGRQEYFHHLLWAMADAEDLQREKKTIKHSYSEICKQKQLSALAENQFDRQFNKLKKTEFGEVIVNAFEGRKGWFKFKENMIRGYVRMLAENNGVSLDFQRRFTAGEPTARHVGVKTSTYKPLTTVEEIAYRIQKKLNNRFIFAQCAVKPRPLGRGGYHILRMAAMMLTAAATISPSRMVICMPSLSKSAVISLRTLFSLLLHIYHGGF